MSTTEQLARLAEWWRSPDTSDAEKEAALALDPADNVPTPLAEKLRDRYLIDLVFHAHGLYGQTQELKDFLSKKRREQD
ncbi:hypothetical protein [Streptomyces sp. NPDC052225]|uniref:hypothetical protein n=1 Tax=Streptomyces sp. NPDC052225 TaxID=3154949 RepID=UPI003422AAA4